MKNKVLSFFALFSLGTVSVQPFTKADLAKVMKISSVIATTPNVVKLINGEDNKDLKIVDVTSNWTYNITSAAIEDCTHLERVNRFLNAISKNKIVEVKDGKNQQGTILQWKDLSVATNVGVAVAFQFVKEICNEVAGRMVGTNKDRIVRRALRTLCIASIEGGVDTLHKLSKEGITKDLLDTFSQSFLTTVAIVATNQIAGEFLAQECDDNESTDLSITDILNFNNENEN